jgi:hypothetical protein
VVHGLGRGEAMICDAHYWKGMGHQVCEDYARAIECSRGLITAVSDGCSGAPDTDIGARLIACAAAHQYILTGGVSLPVVVDTVQRLVPPGIHTDCLHATLLTIQPDERGVVASVTGDGLVLVRHRDTKLIEVYDVDYQDVPGYPYYLHEDKQKVFFGQGYGQRVISRHLEGEDCIVIREDMVTPETLTYSLPFPSSMFDLVMVCTDGVKTFRDASSTPVPTMDVAKYLMDIRVLKGEFVQRAANFFRKMVVAKQGWSHYDDIGLGAIYMPEPEEDNDGC